MLKKYFVGLLVFCTVIGAQASNVPWLNQAAKTFLAAPNGSAGNMSARLIVASDIPTLNQNTTGTASNVTGIVAVANGGTNSSTALNNNRIIISSGGAIVEDAAITANKALASNGSGIPVASATTDTQLGYLSTTTSDVQTQLNGKLASAGTGLIEEIAGDIETVADKTYVLDQKAAFAYTINTFDVATSSGTTTVALKINGTSVTGCSAVSVSSTPATGTCTAANSVSAGDKVTLVTSGTATALDMAFTTKVTR